MKVAQMAWLLESAAKGPGRGWWGPPKGTHGSGSQGGSTPSGAIPWTAGKPEQLLSSTEAEILKEDERLDDHFGLLEWNNNHIDGFIDSGKIYRTFHSTSQRNIESIRDEGLKPPEGVSPARWYMTTTSIEGARSYGTVGNAVMIEYRIPSAYVNDFLWRGSSHSEYYGIQRGIRKPLPGKFIHAVYNVRSPDFPKG